ncbi:MAG: hypothetical protein A2W22_06365 [Candidatus Levybacteria bacterium RBG_16_35_11]|nr:MAG: hypothetical protein A2W22_06365 [Candidatus Levybacteria bacterium RBG_16_35_11]
MVKVFHHEETKGDTVGSQRKMTRKQKDIVIGMILGDAYLQKTGKQNARLRLEQGISQRDYLEWKVRELKNYFQSKIKTLERNNPIWRRTYQYVRIQSTASPDFGKLRSIFYNNSQKIIPKTIAIIFKNPLSLAVWFMDDGHYYQRDRMAYLYIPNFDKESIKLLLEMLKVNFNLLPIAKQKKRGNVLVFSVNETKKLMNLIQKYIIPSMRYKLPLDPVSTDRKSDFRISSEMVL